MKQLSDEYETCLENLSRTSKVLEAKKGVLPDLRRAVHDARARYKGAQKAIEQRSKVKSLKREIAWSHVKKKEEVIDIYFLVIVHVSQCQQEMNKMIEQVAVLARKIPRIETNVDQARVGPFSVRLEMNIDLLSRPGSNPRQKLSPNWKLNLMSSVIWLLSTRRRTNFRRS